MAKIFEMNRKETFPHKIIKVYGTVIIQYFIAVLILNSLEVHNENCFSDLPKLNNFVLLKFSKSLKFPEEKLKSPDGQYFIRWLRLSIITH